MYDDYPCAHDTPFGLIIAICIVVIISCLAIGHCTGEKEVRKEAVKEKHAEYVADENGNSTFKWKTK